MDEDARVPIAKVLSGMELHPLPEGWTPVEAFVMVKALDEDQEPSWCFRTTNQLNREELLGALVVQTEYLRQSLVEEWDSD